MAVIDSSSEDKINGLADALGVVDVVAYTRSHGAATAPAQQVFADMLRKQYKDFITRETAAGRADEAQEFLDHQTQHARDVTVDMELRESAIQTVQNYLRLNEVMHVHPKGEARLPDMMRVGIEPPEPPPQMPQDKQPRDKQPFSFDGPQDPSTPPKQSGPEPVEVTEKIEWESRFMARQHADCIVESWVAAIKENEARQSALLNSPFTMRKVIDYELKHYPHTQAQKEPRALEALAIAHWKEEVAREEYRQHIHELQSPDQQKLDLWKCDEAQKHDIVFYSASKYALNPENRAATIEKVKTQVSLMIQRSAASVANVPLDNLPRGEYAPAQGQSAPPATHSEKEKLLIREIAHLRADGALEGAVLAAGEFLSLPKLPVSNKQLRR